MSSASGLISPNAITVSTAPLLTEPGTVISARSVCERRGRSPSLVVAGSSVNDENPETVPKPTSVSSELLPIAKSTSGALGAACSIRTLTFRFSTVPKGVAVTLNCVLPLLSARRPSAVSSVRESGCSVSSAANTGSLVAGDAVARSSSLCTPGVIFTLPDDLR